MKEPVKEIPPLSLWDRTHDFFFGAPPQSPREKMAEIEARMKKLQTSLDTDRDIKKFDLNRQRKELDKVAAKGDEGKVREIARECVRLDKLHRNAETRHNKVTMRIDMMMEMGVGGQLSNDTIEYMQCHNKIMAKTANSRVAGNTIGQFQAQAESVKLYEEMMEEALAISEDEDKLDMDSQAVEALVKESMSNSSLAVLNKLPSIKGVDYMANANNKNPATTAKNIQQFLEKK